MSEAAADVQLWVTSTGGGHRRVAEAVRAALREAGGPALKVAIDDPLRVGALPQARLLLGGYGPVVRWAPALWGALFWSFSLPVARRSLELFLLSGVQVPMARTTRRRQPRVVVNLHPLLGPAALRAARETSAAMLTVITDLTRVHPGWLSPRGIPLLSPSEAATRSCVRQGVDPSLVETTGLPVDPRLKPISPAARSAIRARLGLDPDLPCFLVSGGAEGAGNVRPLLEELEKVGPRIQVVLFSGRNLLLLRWARARRWGIPLIALPFLNDPTDWLLAADAYLGKAGPSALAEGAAAGMALILTSALPGQEQANLEWATRAGVAVDARAPGALAELIPSLLRDQEAGLRSLQERSLQSASPLAAQRVAAAILRRL